MTNINKIPEYIQLVKSGKATDEDFSSYEEKKNLQYCFEKYSKNVIGFILDLKKEDIDFKHHFCNASGQQLRIFLDSVIKKGIFLDSIEKPPEVLKMLGGMEFFTSDKKMLLKRSERTDFFNNHATFEQADEKLRVHLFSKIDLKVTMGFRIDNPLALESVGGHDLLKNDNDFGAIRAQLEKNVAKFKEHFDVKKLTAHDNYENYLKNSFGFTGIMKKIITSKNFKVSELFDVLEPVMPRPDKKAAFTNIMLSNFFGHVMQFSLDKSFLPVVNDMVEFMEKNKVAFNAKQFIQNDLNLAGNLSTSIELYRAAPKFITLLNEMEPKEMKKQERAMLHYGLQTSNFERDITSLKGLETKVEQLSSLITKLAKEDKEFSLKIDGEFFAKIKVKMQDIASKEIKFEIFTKIYKELSQNPPKEEKRVYEALKEEINRIGSRGLAFIWHMVNSSYIPLGNTDLGLVLEKLQKTTPEEIQKIVNATEKTSALLDDFHQFTSAYIEPEAVNKKAKLRN